MATQAEHGRGIQSSVRGADTRATLPDLGIPRQRAAEMKQLAALGEELKAAQERGEVARKNEPVSQYVRAADIPPATLSDLGIPRQPGGCQHPPRS